MLCHPTIWPAGKLAGFGAKDCAPLTPTTLIVTTLGGVGAGAGAGAGVGALAGVGRGPRVRGRAVRVWGGGGGRRRGWGARGRWGRRRGWSCRRPLVSARVGGAAAPRT